MRKCKKLHIRRHLQSTITCSFICPELQACKSLHTNSLHMWQLSYIDRALLQPEGPVCCSIRDLNTRLCLPASCPGIHIPLRNLFPLLPFSTCYCSHLKHNFKPGIAANKMNMFCCIYQPRHHMSMF